MEQSPDKYIDSQSYITEETLLELTEWQTLDKILVISLRNKGLNILSPRAQANGGYLKLQLILINNLNNCNSISVIENCFLYFVLN